MGRPRLQFLNQVARNTLADSYTAMKRTACDKSRWKAANQSKDLEIRRRRRRSRACWSTFQTWIFRKRSRHFQPGHSSEPRAHLTSAAAYRNKFMPLQARYVHCSYPNDMTVAHGLSKASCSSLSTAHASRLTAPAPCRNASTRSPKGGQSPAP